MSSDDSFSSFYTDLISRDDKSNRTLRFFERKQGDSYYTVHGDDALYVADQYYSTRDVVKTSGSPPLSYVNVSNAKLIRIIKHLLTETSSSTGYHTVEILSKDTRGVFRVVKSGTRSKLTQFEAMFDGMTSDAVVMAIKLVIKDKTRHLGVAFADATNRTLEIAEFDDTERFANLEAIIVQRGAKECLMSMDASLTPGDIHKIQAILERCDIPIKECKSSEFKSHDIQQDLGRLIKHGMEKHLSDLEKTIAMSCLACLITHLNLLSDSTGFGRFTLRHVDLSQYMKLDQAAVHALNLNPTQQDSDRNMSLYGLLNKCQTHQGSRLLRQWLHQPLLDVDAINTRLNYVSLFTHEMSLRESLSDQLKRVPDLDRLSKQMQKGRANLQSLYQIYLWCQRLPHMIGTLKEYEGEYVADLKRDFIEKLEIISEELKNFEMMVTKTIDMDAIEQHEYRVNPEFNDALGELSSQMHDILTQIRDSVEGVADDLGLDASKVKLNEHKTMGYHYRVSRKDEPHLRGTSKYITLETRKDGVRFTSSKMKKLSTQYAELQEQYEIQQLDVVKKALEIAATYSMVMEDANEILAQLDVLVALAVVAVSAPTPYVRPTMKPKGSGTLHLIGCRHPCMETLDIGSFIANDVHMERGKSNVQLITGPNMGGKSTYIRQTGVVVLMAQIGSFVPCTEAEISVMDCILARVGAGDSQLKGVSTFMKEMLEASSILEAATPDSLIIIDELGRGTSTYDGFGLAWAITEHIAKNIGSFALFATHFHELTELADQLPNVINRHVTADTSNDSITMLYQVRDGPCDRSFGIYVSELAQFPTEVVQMAKRKAAELETFGSQIDIVEKKSKPTEVKMDEEGLNADENIALDKMTAYARTISHLPASQFQSEFRSYIDKDPILISLAKRLGMMPAA